MMVAAAAEAVLFKVKHHLMLQKLFYEKFSLLAYIFFNIKSKIQKHLGEP